jgi:cell division protein FtsB
MLAVKKNEYAYNYLEKNDVISHSSRSGKKVNKNNFKLKIISSILLFFVCAFLYTAGTAVEAIKINKINALKSEMEDLKLKNERLSLKVSKLRSLDRIEELAVNDLGMKEPDFENVKVISGERAETIQDIILKTEPINIAENSNLYNENSDKNFNPYVVTISNLISNWLISN